MNTVDVDITFARDYYTQAFGLVYDSEYFSDISARGETDRKAKRALHARLGDVGLGEPDPAPSVQLGFDDTLNITLMFGGELRMGGGVTWVEPGFFPRTEIGSLVSPDIAGTWPQTRFLEQYERGVRAFGREFVFPPRPHGIFEIALDMFGDGFLEDFLLEPQRVDRALDLLAETVIAFKEFWDRVCYGAVRPNLSLGGCSTTMVSQEAMERFLVPRYRRIAGHFTEAFICACGKTTQHLDSFAGIPDAPYVRVGWGTDLERTAAVLSGKHVKAGIDVVRAAELPAAGVERDVEHILHTLKGVRALSVLLIHAGADTPDENVRAIVRTVVRFAEDNGIELRDTGSCQLCSVAGGTRAGDD